MRNQERIVLNFCNSKRHVRKFSKFVKMATAVSDKGGTSTSPINYMIDLLFRATILGCAILVSRLLLSGPSTFDPSLYSRTAILRKEKLRLLIKHNLFRYNSNIRDVDRIYHIPDNPVRFYDVKSR